MLAVPGGEPHHSRPWLEFASMMLSYIRNILTKDQLNRLHALIRTSRFNDGLISARGARNKHNLELSVESREYIEVVKIVEVAVRENTEFNMTAFPRYMTRPIVSRYETGMYYGSHVDLPIMGFLSVSEDLRPVGANYVRSDLSMTVFLNDPDTYEGGDLTFEGPIGPICSKLEAGNGILYPTGSRHSVAAVTKGIRYAAILWIQTLFPIEAHRRAIIDAYRLLGRMQAGSEEYQLAEENFYNLCRILANV
jgi:PKHD-type hydroxylase